MNHTNMADWLNIQLGFKTQEFEFYHDNFCVDCFSKQAGQAIGHRRPNS